VQTEDEDAAEDDVDEIGTLEDMLEGVFSAAAFAASALHVSPEEPPLNTCVPVFTLPENS